MDRINKQLSRRELFNLRLISLKQKEDRIRLMRDRDKIREKLNAEHDKKEEQKMQVQERQQKFNRESKTIEVNSEIPTDKSLSEDNACTPLKVEHNHPHIDKCGARDSFEMALKTGHLVVIEGELQIQGRLPEGAKAGNIITKEEYDPKQFHFNICVTYCPFCGMRIDN